MSKKTPVKKSRRRLKRSVRRSLAAVLMITAIVVAAIPVPENYAAPEDDITTPTVTEPKGYQYPTDMADRGIYTDPSLSAGNKKKEQSLTIKPLSDGTYQLDWQFEFFRNGNEGIISKYNSTYQEDRVELKPNVIYEYDIISGDDYTGFYKKQELKSYICDGEPKATNSADKFMSTYFPDAYQQYCDDYTAYQNSTDPNPKAPDPLIRYVVAGTFTNGDKTEVHEVAESLSESDKLQYYCEQNGMPEYKLAVVIKRLDSVSEDAANQRVYIPRLREGQTKSELDLVDDNGFKYLKDSSIIGIGDNAFKDTQNVYYLTVPEEIKYVGESAFEHSFLKEITFVNIEHISDFAFKNCTQLEKIELGDGVGKIGTEAFCHTAITSVVFPATTEEIGPGAFAYCESLQTIDFSRITTTPAKIDEYAFYNNVALNSVNVAKADGALQADGSPVTVNIDTIGDYAFAIYSGDVGSMTDFVFPNKISTVWKQSTRKGLGDGVLAGRTKLRNVTMPADFGRSAVTQVPDNTFYGCYNLECVKFPDDKGGSCGYASYTPEKLFASVSNANFYVQGPELDNTQQKDAYAQPRKCTWDAVTAAAKIDEKGNPVPNVPYLYIRDGKKFYEIGSSDYLMCVNEDGILTSCRLKDGVNPTTIDLEIWAQVGTTKVTGIAGDCFSDDKMNQKVRTLTIFDNSLSTIDANVFKGWGKLEKVFIGNSVTSIGASAFEGCHSLKDVTFNTPESAAANFTVGENAFRTNGSELTFHGLISQNFAPYTWAMDKDNAIDPDRGVRVCYKSLAPSNLTVMYNDDKGEITLLDYPKYNQVEELLGEQYATREGVDWARSGFSSAADYYQSYMENMYYNLYSTELYESKRKAFKDEWDKATDDAAIKALYNDPVLYGPWVNPEFAALVNKGEGGGTTSASADKGMFDWLFEPLVAQAAPAGTKLQAYYDYSEDGINRKYAYNATENYERSSADAAGPYQSSTTDELKAFDATKNIVVPDGVTSIDVNGYLEAQANVSNRATYFTSDRLGSSYKMYTDSHSESAVDEYKYTDHDKDHLAGLFSGMYRDYDTAEDEEGVYEKAEKGNDRVESIDLNGVTYLPAYAFDGCENLQTVKIGDACTDIGKLPFRGCTSLTDVQIAETNPKYQEDNRIIYSYKNDEAGNTLYKIEECLETRGKGSNSSTLVDSALDSKIINVNEIADGAFESCDYIRKIHMTDAVRLATIPDRTFKSCNDLDNIELPATVNKIDKEAFALSNNLASIRIPGREVFISTEAFADNNKRETLIVTYEDSSARRYADTYAETYKLYFDKIGDLWEVAFYDMDGTQIGDPFSVEDNTRLTDDQIPEDPVRAGYTFDKWVGTGGVDVRDPITQSTNFIAKYNSNSGMVGDKYVVTFLDGLDGSLLTGEGANRVDGLYYVEAGTSFAENNLKAPEPKTHDGFTFLTWSDNWTVNTVIDNNMPIIALYSENGSTTPTPGGTPGTNPGTSTGTTTNTSNKSTSSSTSSTSTSSSSTSSTSTTSGSSSEKAFYTVTVENGHGSGSYAAGSTVIIAANTPAAGMQFSKWTTESNGVNLASVSMTATTFTMPENNVTVTANYVTAGTPTATPVSGTGTTTPARDDGDTRVDITKPGISNKDLATANVNGSTDNFIVKISETDEATQAVSAALLNKYGNLDNILYYAMDISLYDSTGTTKITDVSGLSIDITIPIPDALITYGGNNMAGAVVNGSQLEDLSEKFTTVNGVPMVTFTATHFSPYTIYVDTGNLVAGELDVTPKTGDPIHPKWFLSIGLACLSIILFIKKDKTKVKVKA